MDYIKKVKEMINDLLLKLYDPHLKGKQILEIKNILEI